MIRNTAGNGDALLKRATSILHEKSTHLACRSSTRKATGHSALMVMRFVQYATCALRVLSSPVNPVCDAIG